MSVSIRRGLAALGTAALILVVAANVAAGPAHAATPLPTPGTPVATSVSTTSVSFSWTPSAEPVAGYTIQTIDAIRQPWRVLATTSGTSYTHAGLLPDSVYEYRVIANPAAGSGYTDSAATPLLWVRTAPLPDSVPPTTPGVPRALPLTTVWATLTFGHSTDNRRVDAYWAQRLVDGVWTDWATNNIPNIILRDLTPGTSYTVAAVAVDANGNRSARSEPLTFTTRAIQPAPTCQVRLLEFSQQYQANIAIENMTEATMLENWTIRFTFPAAQTLQYSFGGKVTRDGTTGIVTPNSYVARLAPGGSASVGFLATNPTGTPLPSDFTMHASSGTYPCGVG
jgi:endoglucanase